MNYAFRCAVQLCILQSRLFCFGMYYQSWMFCSAPATFIIAKVKAQAFSYLNVKETFKILLNIRYTWCMYEVRVYIKYIMNFQ